ncbi:hypothetical protein PHYSODRAFT_321372 [Phytophthora sojae]|uniref:Uncharacterized protein n=1 Tax=Phytophthora sojae (strain P6497) TaxID=1094619 RepID=G4YEN6_PHYSP|nr:hypothetical protein PHYSODRAFT_321372 [Phytophthora sojae]EGZ27577.1 hypothetical protein PHYSODRAFT_321372 [Phytophthora sojae]|eukprot:XP_009514852.1 hypothetical protein PHYSODRAFT_321372 [Phytophthora sojae]
MSSPKKTDTYRERHKAKRDALAAKAAAGTTQPEIVLEGSSVVNDAVDYGDDDVEMEEGEASSSKRKESIDSNSLDPHAGSRRPREGDDSDASSSKRSRGESDTPISAAGALNSPREVAYSSSPRAAGAARDPWMPSTSEIADRVGNTVPPNEIPVYVCSGIHDDAVAEEQHFDPDRDLNGYTTIRVPVCLKDLRAKFLAREERDNRGTSGAAGDCSARTTNAPAVRVELRTPSPFPECPAAGRPAAPMYLGGAETLSNEYDNERVAGSFSGYYGPQYAQQSSVLSLGRRASEAVVVGTRPGYGQPGVDLGPTLEERVAAVEQHQSRVFAALKQEGAIMRAQVAQGSQTASDISVDVGGRVARLAQRVHALEQRFAPAGPSASGQPS